MSRSPYTIRLFMSSSVFFIRLSGCRRHHYQARKLLTVCVHLTPHRRFDVYLSPQKSTHTPNETIGEEEEWPHSISKSPPPPPPSIDRQVQISFDLPELEENDGGEPFTVDQLCRLFCIPTPTPSTPEADRSIAGPLQTPTTAQPSHSDPPIFIRNPLKSPSPDHLYTIEELIPEMVAAAAVEPGHNEFVPIGKDVSQSGYMPVHKPIPDTPLYSNDYVTVWVPVCPLIPVHTDQASSHNITYKMTSPQPPPVPKPLTKEDNASGTTTPPPFTMQDRMSYPVSIEFTDPPCHAQTQYSSSGIRRRGRTSTKATTPVVLQPPPPCEPELPPFLPPFNLMDTSTPESASTDLLFSMDDFTALASSTEMGDEGAIETIDFEELVEEFLRDT